MTEAAWIGDAAGRLSYVNQAFCALTGYAAGDCLGRCWDILQVRWAAAVVALDSRRRKDVARSGGRVQHAQAASAGGPAVGVALYGLLGMPVECVA